MTDSPNARDEILARIRHALTDTPPDDTYAVTRDYHRQHGQRTEAQNIELLAENLTDYRAHVHRTDQNTLPATIARLLAEHGSTSVVIPHALPEAWTTALTGEIIPDTPDLTPHRLDQAHAVISACALAIAETGTIILDTGPGQGRRLLTLIPDHHICVVQVPQQLVASVPQALKQLDPTRPQTWISGPSATSDIELDRVEGVHGPRKLDVILVG